MHVYRRVFNCDLKNIIMNTADSGGDMKEMPNYGSEVGKRKSTDLMKMYAG